MTFQLEFPSGVIGNCSTTYSANGSNKCRALAERGWFGLEPAFDYTGIRGATSRGALTFPAVDQFAAEIDDFARCILENRESQVAGAEGLRDLRIVEAIYASIRTGRAVDLG